jgi:hypothetical protein
MTQPTIAPTRSRSKRLATRFNDPADDRSNAVTVVTNLDADLALAEENRSSFTLWDYIVRLLGRGVCDGWR